MKYAVIVAAVLGALGARGAYAQGDNSMGGTSPPDQEQMPQKQDTSAQQPERTPDQSATQDQDKDKDKTQAQAQAQVTDQTGKTIESEDLLFPFNSSQLSADASTKLKPIADWAKCNTKGAVIIEGHADPRGSADYNQKLSAERAAVVRQKLVDLGVPSARIVMSVYGENGPRRENFAEDRRATVRPALTPVPAAEVTAQR